MVVTDSNYYIENPDEFDELTDEDKDRILDGGIIEKGDTETKVEEISEPPDAEPEVLADTKPEASSNDDAEAVLLAKDGLHQIPYSELENARSEAHEWRQQAEQQAELIKQLEAAKIQDAGTGDTKAQEAVIEEYAGEFPEVAEDLKPYIQKMINAGIDAELKKQVEQRVMPLEQRLQEQLQKEHNQAIWAVHPDISERLDEAAFNAFATENPWLLDSKSKAPLNIATVLQQGTAAEVNEVLAQYKQTLQQPEVKPEPAPDKSALTGKAKTVISNVKAKAPGTFSDMPAVLGKHDETERILTMSDSELEKTFLTMTESERNKLFERLV